MKNYAAMAEALEWRAKGLVERAENMEYQARKLRETAEKVLRNRDQVLREGKVPNLGEIVYVRHPKPNETGIPSTRYPYLGVVVRSSPLHPDMVSVVPLPLISSWQKSEDREINSWTGQKFDNPYERREFFTWCERGAKL